MPAALPCNLTCVVNCTAHVLHRYRLQVKDYVVRYAKAEDVAALEEAEKHGGGGGDGAERMSEDESGGWRLHDGSV